MGSSSTSKASYKSDIERCKRNIENDQAQIKSIKERIANCKRSHTNYAKDSYDSQIASLKRDIENQKYQIARLREQMKNA